jgi:AcrR family transcriptional regulator
LFNFAGNFKIRMEFNSKQIEILNVVEQLVSEKGINATSVREIAKESRINIAMISYYFGSKDKLIESLFEYKIGKMHNYLSKLKDDKKHKTRERLSAFLRIYLETIVNNNTFYKIMMREFSLKTVSDSIYEKISELKIKNLQMVDAILEEGYEKGDFSNKVSGEFILAIVIGSSSYFIMNQNMYMKYWKCKNQKDYTNIILKKHLPNVINSIDTILHFNNEK